MAEARSGANFAETRLRKGRSSVRNLARHRLRRNDARQAALSFIEHGADAPHPEINPREPMTLLIFYVAVAIGISFLCPYWKPPCSVPHRPTPPGLYQEAVAGGACD